MSSTDPRSGFTLLEVVAVMVIVAMVASLTVAALHGTGRASLKAVVMDTAALMRRERMDAILGSQVRRVSLDGDRRILIGDDGQSVAIPRDVVLNLLGPDTLWSGRLAVVSFDPDGASTGAVLRFSREKAEYEVRVNWYTGGISVLVPQTN